VHSARAAHERYRCGWVSSRHLPQSRRLEHVCGAALPAAGDGFVRPPGWWFRGYATRACFAPLAPCHARFQRRVLLPRRTPSRKHLCWVLAS
jgi:hypothetical protein